MADDEIEQAKHSLERGSRFPYDAADAWWRGSGEAPPSPKDWAHNAARGVIADLEDRRGIKRGLEEIDEEIRIEIVASLSEIIRQAAP